MTDWANIKTKLLNFNHCANILVIAIHILEGLSSFYLEVIGVPNWKSLPPNKYIQFFSSKTLLTPPPKKK